MNKNCFLLYHLASFCYTLGGAMHLDPWSVGKPNWSLCYWKDGSWTEWKVRDFFFISSLHSQNMSSLIESLCNSTFWESCFSILYFHVQRKDRDMGNLRHSEPRVYIHGADRHHAFPTQHMVWINYLCERDRDI